jgi:segregation and condensation protein A
MLTSADSPGASHRSGTCLKNFCREGAGNFMLSNGLPFTAIAAVTGPDSLKTASGSVASIVSLTGSVLGTSRRTSGFLPVHLQAAEASTVSISPRNCELAFGSVMDNTDRRGSVIWPGTGSRWMPGRNSLLILTHPHRMLAARQASKAELRIKRYVSSFSKRFEARANHGMVMEVSSPLDVRLEQYEGPLDLLLDLIRKQQINIYDIPIAQITSQYLEYVQQAMGKDMEVGSEFVYMAATLIHIKSKMLLPRDPELAKMEQDEDPRAELVNRLLEHERFKNAAEMLQQKRMIEEAVWSNPQIDQFVSEDDDPGLAVTLFDLVKTLQGVLERAKNRPIYAIEKDDVSVPDMVSYLKAIFVEKPKEKMSVLELFERQRSRRAMVCLFLAILEMVKRQAVALEQSELFGNIVIHRHEKFDDAFAGEDAISVIDKDYS